MATDNRKNVPEEKKKARNQHDTSAENILDEKPEQKHFNEGVESRIPDHNPDMESDPDAHLGAQEIDEDRAMTSTTNESTTGITAPEIRQEIEEEEEETLEEIKKDMTGG